MPAPPYQPIVGEVLSPAGVDDNRDTAFGWSRDVTPAADSIGSEAIFPPFAYPYPQSGMEGVTRSAYGRIPDQDAHLHVDKARRRDMFNGEYVTRPDGLMVIPNLAWSGFVRAGDKAIIRATFSHQHFFNADQEEIQIGNHRLIVKPRGRTQAEAVFVAGVQVPTFAVTTSADRQTAVWPLGSLMQMVGVHSFGASGVFDIAVVLQPELGAYTPYQHLYGRGAMTVMLSRGVRPAPTLTILGV